MEQKIVKTYQQICLYCGNEIRITFEEYEFYYECDCPDTKLEREIKEKIRELERQFPVQKFAIVQENVLHELKNKD